MNSINNVTISGRLTRDAEVKYIDNGNTIANWTIAVNKKYKKHGAAEYTEEVSFIDGKAFRWQAEALGKHGKKGREIAVWGSLKQESWEKDGKKHSKLVVIADRIVYAERLEDDKPQVEGAPTPAPKPSKPAPAPAAEESEPPF